MIVGGLHPAIGEIQCTGHHNASTEQRRRNRQQQAAGGNRIGRNKHVGDKIDDEVKRLARPVGLQLDDIQTTGNRSIEAVDDQRQPEPGKHRRPVFAHRFQQRDQGDPCPQRRENMNAEGSGARRP